MMRAINHYRLDGNDPSIVASGHTVLDLGIAKQLTGSYHPGFLVFGLLAAGALLALTGVKSRWRRTWGASAELGSARI